MIKNKVLNVKFIFKIYLKKSSKQTFILQNAREQFSKTVFS